MSEKSILYFFSASGECVYVLEAFIPQLQILTHKRHAQLFVNVSIFSQCPKYQTISTIKLGKTNVSLHHFSFTIWIQKITSAWSNHHKNWNLDTLFYYLKNTFKNRSRLKFNYKLRDLEKLLNYYWSYIVLLLIIIVYHFQRERAEESEKDNTKGRRRPMGNGGSLEWMCKEWMKFLVNVYY